MQVSLSFNTGFITLPNGIVLTTVNRGPVKVDIEQLNVQQKLQFISQLQRKVVIPVKNDEARADIKKLEEFLENVQQSTVQKSETVSIEPKVSGFQEETDRMIKESKKLLRKKVEVIKLEAEELSPRELSILIDVEKSWKKRKGLVDYLEKLLLKIRTLVPENLKGLNRKDTNLLESIAKSSDLPPHLINQVSQVEDIEEDEEEVIIEIGE